MTRFDARAIRLLLLAALLAPAGIPLPAVAQVETAPPIKVKAPKKKLQTFKGEVLSATTQQIIVRSRDNVNVVRTFSYTPEVQKKMREIVNSGGYQFGDKVEIQFEPGSDVALKIKGKPSKPV